MFLNVSFEKNYFNKVFILLYGIVWFNANSKLRYYFSVPRYEIISQLQSVKLFLSTKVFAASSMKPSGSSFEI